MIFYNKFASHEKLYLQSIWEFEEFDNPEESNDDKIFDPAVVENNN